MPKLTRTGYEIGSSEAGAILLHKTAFQTRHEVLRKHKLARAGVEDIDTIRNPNALQRGTHLEGGVASWAAEKIEELSSMPVDMYEPTEAFRKPDYGIASSIDRIIELRAPLHLDRADGSVATLQGKCIMEVKTDFYHRGKPKPEWQVQVLHQMLCSDIRKGLIVCMDQAGKLHMYPVDYDKAVVTAMIDAFIEFWELVKSDGDYPPIATEEKSTPVDLTKELPKTNVDVAALCSDYLVARGAERAAKKLADDAKDAIAMAMDALNIEHATLPGFEIKSGTVRKQKKRMVNTGEYYDADTFSVKEVNDG